jgi:hypothetical protein
MHAHAVIQQYCMHITCIHILVYVYVLMRMFYVYIPHCLWGCRALALGAAHQAV